MLETVLGFQVYQVSFLNLAIISLERVHATFRPFKHRFVKKWVYGVVITVIWLVPTVMNSISSGIVPLTFFFAYYAIIVFAFYFTVLFVVVVCYTSICLKVRCNHPRQHCAAGVREKKTDGYFISCHFWIVNNVPARDCLLGFLGFQSRVCFKLLQSVII